MLIINNILKIRVHILFYLMAFITIITGFFKEFIIFTTIIVLHELGHILAGLIMGEIIEKIIILPFGGLTIFNMKLNIPLKKELFIALSGPIFQIICWFFISQFYHDSLFSFYNKFILLFNLLPIYPLDGSKIFNCLLNYFFSYKCSFYVTIFFSIFLLAILLVLTFCKYFNLMFLIILFFIGYKAVTELFNFKSILNKFLLERLCYDFNFQKLKYIKNILGLYRDRRHIINDDGVLKTEKEILRKRFDFKRNV